MVLALLIPDLGNTEIFQLIGGEIASLARRTLPSSSKGGPQKLQSAVTGWDGGNEDESFVVTLTRR